MRVEAAERQRDAQAQYYFEACDTTNSMILLNESDGRPGGYPCYVYFIVCQMSTSWLTKARILMSYHTCLRPLAPVVDTLA